MMIWKLRNNYLKETSAEQGKSIILFLNKKKLVALLRL